MAETSREHRPLTAPDGAVQLLECAFEEASLAALRREVTRCAAANGLTDLALSNFVLAVNEITTNALRYAGGHGRLHLWRHREYLWCRVVDDGPGIPPKHLNQVDRPKPGQLRGCGLWLTRHICDSVEIDTDRFSGTRVLLKYGLRSVDSGSDRLR